MRMKPFHRLILLGFSSRRYSWSVRNLSFGEKANISERHEKSFIFPPLLTKTKNNCDFKLFHNYQFQVIIAQVPIRSEWSRSQDTFPDVRLWLQTVTHCDRTLIYFWYESIWDKTFAHCQQNLQSPQSPQSGILIVREANRDAHSPFCFAEVVAWVLLLKQLQKTTFSSTKLHMPFGVLKGGWMWVIYSSYYVGDKRHHVISVW